MSSTAPTATPGRPGSKPPATPHATLATRRAFLRYVGAGAAGVAAANVLGPLARPGAARAEAAGNDWATADAWVTAGGAPAWRPVDYPLPNPGDGGSAATDAARLARYQVHDDLLLPHGFEKQVIARWGDVFGPTDRPDRQVRFGYNADYTGLLPVAGSPGDYWLIVNHEYVSARPWLQGLDATGRYRVSYDGACVGGLPLHGMSVDLLDERAVAAMPPDTVAALRRLCAEAMGDLGVSVLRVRRGPGDTFSVVAGADDHLRVSGDPRQPRPAGGIVATGPAAVLVQNPTGTFSNCSGATTPWGTFLTCEENFQDQVPEFISPDGRPLPGDRKNLAASGEPHPTGLPFEFEGLGTGTEPPLDGRHYGWVCEVDPVARSLKKHTALGRFRHENVALRVDAGRPLAAYMGDDRRGGHVWKFVSRGVVYDPADPANAKLLEEGTLYVARFHPDYGGEWVALRPETPLARPNPSHLASGHLWLPLRPRGGHVAVGTTSSKAAEMAAEEWVATVEAFASRPFAEATLGDLVRPPAGDDAAATAGASGGPDERGASAVLLADAYAMANAAGGTPCSRPEDVEVHPVDRSVYVAFTDSTGGGDGSPDVRIFPDSAGDNSRQYGAIYRLAEDGDDPAAETFTWGRFVSSGEAAEGGGGFACADNLAFDPAGNLWMVCDISSLAHNFPVTRTGDDKTLPGHKNFVGVFGNNALFMIPTAGPHAGVPFCFAIGPTECELTGPTFTDDGRTLILSVQHPGEVHGTRGMPGVGLPAAVEREMRLAARDGTLFTQRRTVPLGSNFPSRAPGEPPRPCVVCITRAPEPSP